MKKGLYLFTILIVLLLASCNRTIDYSGMNNEQKLPDTLCTQIEEHYEDWEQVKLQIDESSFVNYYVIQKDPTQDQTKTLMIYLDGSGYDSVMGVKNEIGWIKPGNPFTFSRNIFSDYDFLAVDKVNVEKAESGADDESVINAYTFENRVNSLVLAIDHYLKENKYDNVYMFGISEGGQILPKVYNQLEQRDKVSGLISLGSGGLSQYEEFVLLKNSDLPMPQDWREAFDQIENVIVDINNSPDSVEKSFFGHTYRRWFGFMNYRPIVDYLEIDIPILMVHGAKDISSPVQASKIVETEFEKNGKTNLTYAELEDMEHGPKDKTQSDVMFGIMKDWIKTYFQDN